MFVKLVSMDMDGYTRLACEGELTSRLLASCPNPMPEVLGTDWAARKIMLDMGGTRYMDSASIGWLINCQRQVKAGGGALVLHSVPRNIRQVLDLLKIGNVVSLADNETAARAHLIGA